jgi:FkbM family methyltransferase
MGVSYALGRDRGLCFLADKVEAAVVFDIGANRGQYALGLASHAKHVVSVEPAPLEFAMLSKHVSMNELANVTVVNAAVHSFDGQVRFFYDPSRPTDGRIEDVSEEFGADHIQVAATTLDSLAEVHEPPTVLKIDVEGAGAHVLKGAQKVLERRPALYFELHNAEERNALMALRDRGYALTMIGSDAAWCECD